jgi:hypothetical protein
MLPTDPFLELQSGHISRGFNHPQSLLFFGRPFHACLRHVNFTETSRCPEIFIDYSWIIWWTCKFRQVILHRIIWFLNESELVQEYVPCVLRMPPLIWMEWINSWKAVGRIIEWDMNNGMSEYELTLLTYLEDQSRCLWWKCRAQ